MDFELNKEEEMLRKSFAELLSKECTFELIRDIKKNEIGYSKTIWRKMAQLGWLGLSFEEEYGGSQGTFMDLFILFEEIGKVLLPSPLFTVVLSCLIINEEENAKIKYKYLPPLVDGKKLMTTALLNEKGMFDFHNPTITVRKGLKDIYVINGTRLLVPYANVADEILLCANLEHNQKGESTLFAVKNWTKGLSILPLNTITGEKSFAVSFKNVNVSSNNIIGKVGQGDRILNRILPKVIILKCGEMIGGMKRLLNMTVDYAKGRHQFGKPIGSFQAIQHYCADMAICIEGAILIAYQAALLISSGVDCNKEVSMAKAWCSDVYKRCTWMSQQIHGAIGFTEEFNINFFYKHAKESELMFGHSVIHRSKVADAIGL